MKRTPPFIIVLTVSLVAGIAVAKAATLELGDAQTGTAPFANAGVRLAGVLNQIYGK